MNFFCGQIFYVPYYLNNVCFFFLALIILST